MATTYASGKVSAGSDDGSVYCLEATSGALLWKHTAAGPNHYLVPNNGVFASPWAVRSGVAVDNGVAYFASGIFPHDGIYLCAVNADTGTRTATNHWQTFHLNQGSFQGYMLLSPTRVYCPGGRSCPWYFNRGTGVLLGQYQDANALGTFALLAGNSIFFGPSARGGAQITEGGSAGDNLATYANGNAMVVTTNRSFLLSDTTLSALNRTTRAVVWTKPAAYPYALILAGSTLYAGGENEVAAFDSINGNKIWRAAVQGRAQGLAVMNGTLFVSTDDGFVHAFIPDQTSDQNSVILE